MLSPCISVTYSILIARQNTICAFPNMPEDFTPLYLSFSFPLAKIWFSPQGIAHMAFFLGMAQTQNVKPRRTLWGTWAQKSFCPLFLTGKTPASKTFPESKGQIQTVAHKERAAKKSPEWVNIQLLLLLSHAPLFATPWTIAHKAPPSKEFSRQEYWSGCYSLLQEIFAT